MLRSLATARISDRLLPRRATSARSVEVVPQETSEEETRTLTIQISCRSRSEPYKWRKRKCKSLSRNWSRRTSFSLAREIQWNKRSNRSRANCTSMPLSAKLTLSRLPCSNKFWLATKTQSSSWVRIRECSKSSLSRMLQQSPSSSWETIFRKKRNS